MPSPTSVAYTVLHPVRFRIVKLLSEEKYASTTRIAEALKIDRRLVNFHLRTLQQYGLVSSTFMSNPTRISKGRISSFYRLTPRVKRAISEIKDSLQSLETEYEEDDMKRVLSSEEEKNKTIEKVKLLVEEKLSCATSSMKIPNLVREICWAVGINLSELGIYKEATLPSSLTRESVAELSEASVSDYRSIDRSLFVNGTLDIDNRKVSFTNKLKIGEGAIESSSSSAVLQSIDLLHDEFEDRNLRESKISTYEEYVSFASEVIATIIRYYLLHRSKM